MGRLEDTLDLEGRKALASVLRGLGTSELALTVGRYEIGEVLGRGACGQVYAAHDPQLDRDVAIKVVLSSSRRRDPDAEARLRREAEALARLQDPHVVPVYDVGIDELGIGAGGRPRRGVYVVMARIQGQTLDAWLREASPTVDEIVDAFVQAARGLQAAHAVDVVHRDFKPGNAMRTDDGTVVVLDFGLARALDEGQSMPSERADRPALISGGTGSLTMAGTVVGTPRYMAPEQHGADAATAAADQFAWCVALWEALDGRPPFRGETIKALAESKRAGQLPPGKRIPPGIREVLARGLAADPRVRWPSMTALCEALAQRGRRRRRRIAGYAAGALALGTVAAFGVDRWSQARAQARCDAEAAAIETHWNAARADEISAAFSTTGVSFADDTWARSRPRLDAYAAQWSAARRRTCAPEDALPPDVAEAARACLDDHQTHLTTLLDELAEPDTQVVHKASLAVATLPPVRACEDDVALRRYMDLPRDPAVREQIRALRRRIAEATAAQAMGRYDEALVGLNEVIERADALGQVALAVEARLAAADSHDRRGAIDEARRLAEAAYFAAEGIDRPDLALRASSTLAFFVGALQADHEGGLRWARTAETLSDRADAEPALVAGMLLNVGTVRRRAGQSERARQDLERALSSYEEAFGPQHPSVASALLNLASAHHDLGHYEKAIELLERGLAIDEATRGPDHPSTAAALNNLGVAYHRRGDYERARRYHTRALEIREKALGPTHADVSVSVNNLGAALRMLGDQDGALAAYERAQRIAEEANGPEHPSVATAVDNLALVYRQRGDLGRARSLHERALEIRERALGAEHPEVATTLAGLGRVHLDEGQATSALPLFERAREIWAKAHGPVHPLVASALEHIGDAHDLAGEPAEAAASYEQALRIHLQIETSADQLAEVRFGLARMLWQADIDRARARALAAEAVATWRALGDAGRDDLAKAQAWLRDHDDGVEAGRNADSAAP